MIRYPLIAWYKFQLGRWLVRKSYARDAVVLNVCKQMISQYRHKILKLSPLPLATLSPVERALAYGQVHRQGCPPSSRKSKRTLNALPLWLRFIRLIGGVHD